MVMSPHFLDDVKCALKTVDGTAGIALANQEEAAFVEQSRKVDGLGVSRGVGNQSGDVRD